MNLLNGSGGTCYYPLVFNLNAEYGYPGYPAYS